MIDLLLTAVLATHLMMVNLAMAGPLFAVWLERRGRKLGQELPGELGQKVAKSSWHALVGAMLLGLAAALILHIPGEEWFRELILMPHGRVHWGAAELLFSLVLMILYAGLWKRLANRPWIHRGIAILAATNLIYHFPTFFVIFSKLRDEGRLLPAISAAEFRSLIVDPEVVARSLHYALASVAMSGVVVMLMAMRRYERDSEEDESAPPQRLAIIAARAALVVSLLQLPVGFMVFVKSPTRDREQLLGGDVGAGAMMLGGILAAVMLLHVLSAIALGEASRTKIRGAALWMLVTIVLMTGVLVRLRQPGPIREEEETAGRTAVVGELEIATAYGDERNTRWAWKQSVSLRTRPEPPPISRWR